MLSLFSFFHLNLAFSSIEEELRPVVINNCYWPLLKMIETLRLPTGIEASGDTLETIHSLDILWIEKLKKLCHEGLVEFIGSGYMQIIGPLAPARLNRENQQIGLETYQKILGFKPETALINEQAYAAGLVPLYKDAGYQAIIMEWDNPAAAHPEWDPEWRYMPQYACGPDDTAIPLIWNKSIGFQKFQRYAHGEMTLDEFLSFIGQRYSTTQDRIFPVYGNDAEIFDFRPGRFNTEAELKEKNEWLRITKLYEHLQKDHRFTFILPSGVLNFLDKETAGKKLSLQSPLYPVPVKKQAKYNLMRWALTGRDDLGINTACWQIFDALSKQQKTEKKDWKELCYLWSSDFRTHITEKRWNRMQARLKTMHNRLVLQKIPPASTFCPQSETAAIQSDSPFHIQRNGHFLEIETAHQKLRLNCRRGLAIDAWWDKNISDKPLVCTLPHGYYDHILYGADFYTGHLILEIPGQHKITDLSFTEPSWAIKNTSLQIRATIHTPLGNIQKTMLVSGERASIEVSCHFDWPICPHGTLRLGHITLNPDAFHSKSLFFSTHNGGYQPDFFLLEDAPLQHLAPVSALVSASQGLGLTEGSLSFGDNKKQILLEVDKTSAALTGHVHYAPLGNQYFYRIILSAMEMDDTACHVKERNNFTDRTIRWRLSAQAKGPYFET